MRKILFVFFIISCAAICFAQSKSFEVFDKAVKNEKGGFSGNKENLSKVFNNERIRLGEKFEMELWKYIGDDVERYYWISFFLDWKGYLHGNEPLPELAFKIRKRGVELLANTEDKTDLGRKITFLRELAVASYLSGNRNSAIEYKTRTIPIYEKYDEIGAYVGATSEFAQCIFNNLEKDPTVCEEEGETENRTEKILNGGVIAGKAISLPQPKYPKKARKQSISGDVQVRVLIDFSGNIISAEAIKGPKELFKAAVEAAKKAKFTPTLLDGKPVKVSGIIIYRFIY